MWTINSAIETDISTDFSWSQTRKVQFFIEFILWGIKKGGNLLFAFLNSRPDQNIWSISNSVLGFYFWDFFLKLLSSVTQVRWMYSGISDPWFHLFRSLLRHPVLSVNTFKSAACTTSPLVAICLMHVIVEITTTSQSHFSVEKESWCSPGSGKFSWKYLLELIYRIMCPTLITCSSSQSSSAHDLLHSDHSLKYLLWTWQQSGEPG